MGTAAAAVEIAEPLLHQDEPAEVDMDELIPDWKEQITIRGLVVSAVLGALFCIITHKLNLTVGIIPSLNVAAGLLGFFSVKSWTGFLTKLGFSSKPFTRQENTVIQTCVVACYGLAFSGNSQIYLFCIFQLQLVFQVFVWLIRNIAARRITEQFCSLLRVCGGELLVNQSIDEEILVLCCVLLLDGLRIVAITVGRWIWILLAVYG